MPVVRSRAGFRFEASRGYPRLKWRDINKGTLITRLDQKESKKRCPPAQNGGRRPVTEAERRRHRCPERLIQSDGESEESSSDNSLIYSDFRLSPQSGKVRMAFTVPLTRLTSSEAKQPVLESTLQIHHKFDRASHGRVSRFSHPCVEPRHVCTKFFNKGTSMLAMEHSQAEKQPHKKVRDYGKHRAKLQNEPKAFDRGTNSSSSLFLPSSAVLCPRPTSFWRDIKAGGKGCLASQKERLRDATFIIYPSDLETDLAREKRKDSSPQREKGSGESVPRGTLLPATASFYAQRPWLASVEDPIKRSQWHSQLEMSAYKRPPITLTSTSHTSLRCYPPLECHPSSECQSHTKKFPPVSSPRIINTRNFGVLTRANPEKKKEIWYPAGLVIKNMYASLDSEEDVVRPQTRNTKQSPPTSFRNRLLVPPEYQLVNFWYGCWTNQRFKL